MSILGIEYPRSGRYRSGAEFEPLTFFFSVLSAATTCDLLLGYFSSTAIATLAESFASFIVNGGTMRLITNHVLNPNDIATIEQAERIKGVNNQSDIAYLLADYRKLKSQLTAYGEHFFNCLAYLIANERIQLIATKPKGSQGITHYKTGTLSDGKSRVMFTSSCNFTYSGLVENLEVLDIKRSWGNELEQFGIIEQEEEFERIFSKEADYVEYLDTYQLKECILTDFGQKQLSELLYDERKLLAEKKAKIAANPRLIKMIEEAEQRMVTQAQTPRFPHVDGPRDYQTTAYQKWVGNQYQGLFAMATGTGKTLTALNCILEEYRLTGHYRVIVVVPTKALAIQWVQEVRSFNFQEVVSTVADKDWTERLSKFSLRRRLNKADNLFIITTYATFNAKKFKAGFYEQLPDLEGFTLIADETHNLGAPKSLKNLPYDIVRRIGLSATPERVYDTGGSAELYAFFNARPPAYTFSYSMKRAIDEGILCRYDYYPLLVALDTDEADEYRKYTAQLMGHFDAKAGHFRPSADWLLMQRKQVIHKARNKKRALQRILNERNAAGQRLAYTFIYVPEGYEPDYTTDDDHSLDPADRRIIDEYAQALNADGYRTHQFLGETADSQRILRQFAEGRLDMLLAMKCLDEGVDVPRTETAIFCASTGNPRQFVQRRGRILRKHKEKHKATLYDMVVMPPFGETGKLAQQEINLFQNELRRVVNFASLADNLVDIMRGDVFRLAETLDIDIYAQLNDFQDDQNQHDNP
ncbi:DEAD/DEAH box helicase family protein [Spirosoma knui]